MDFLPYCVLKIEIKRRQFESIDNILHLTAWPIQQEMVENQQRMTCTTRKRSRGGESWVISSKSKYL